MVMLLYPYMNKYFVIFLVIIFSVIIFNFVIVHTQNIMLNNEQSSASIIQNALKNSTFVINDTKVTLNNGVATESINNSAAKIITRYFGNESFGDLNHDGIPDTAYLITQETGGTGAFYYVVVGLAKNNSYEYTNPIYIGDRIAPQNSLITDGKLYVNYAERNPGEPIATQPSLGVTKVLIITSANILEELK